MIVEEPAGTGHAVVSPVKHIPLRILLIQNSRQDTDRALDELRRAGMLFQTTVATTEPEFLRTLHRGIDLILADFNLPELSAGQALQLLRQRDLDIPFILIAGAIGEESVAELIRNGADDYLPRDRLARLNIAVTQALQLRRARAERKKSEANRTQQLQDLQERVGQLTALQRDSVLPASHSDAAGLSQDVTAILNATEELEKREALLATAERLANMGCWEMNLETNHLLWSDQLIRIFGTSREEFRNDFSDFHSRIHPDDWDMVMQALTDVHVGKYETSLQYRIVRPDGEIRVLEERGEVICDETGKAIRRVGMTIDVTERENSIAALRQSEERFQLAVRGTSSGIWDWDLRSDLVYYSDRFKQLLGYQPEEFPPKLSSMLDSLHPDDQTPVTEAIQQHLLEEQPYNIEYRLRTKQGVYRWFYACGAALRDQDGNPLRMAGSVIDITRTREVEQSLRSLNEDLENRVRIRTQELQESSRRHATLLSNLQGMAYRCVDPDYQVMEFASEGLVHIVGVNGSALSDGTTTFLSLVHPDDRPRFLEMRRQCFQTTSPLEFEYRLQHAERSVVWVLEQSRGIQDGRGVISAIEGYVTDITHRKMRELRDRCQRTVFEMLASNASLESCLFTIAECVESDSLRLYCAFVLVEQHEKRLTVAAAPRLDESCIQLIETQRPDESLAAAAAVSRQRIFFRDVVSHPKWKSCPLLPDEFHVECFLSEPLKTATDDVPGTLDVFVKGAGDLSEQQRERIEWAAQLAGLVLEHIGAKRALTESESFSRATLDALSAHIAVLNAEGRIVATNRAWQDFATANLGDSHWIREQTDYLQVCQRAAENGCKDAQYVVEQLTQTLHGDVRHWELQYPCEAFGQQLWFLVRAARVSVNGEPHAILAHENVTAMKQTEQNLRIAMQSAEQASQAKTEFLATVSHELRTPLNGILGMSDLLSRTELTSEQKRYVEASEASGRMLMALINDVLDLAKIEAGKLELETREFELPALLRDLATTFESLTREKGLSLRVQIPADLNVIVRCDDYRIRQILMNLTGNAIKFTQSGGITLSVRNSTAESQNMELQNAKLQHIVRFAVQDSGIGIPDERRNRLFKAFSQVDSSTTRQYGGTGLGLSICKNLVELMGGTIGVESRVGVGSTFWFEISMEFVQVVSAVSPDAETPAAPTAGLISPHVTPKRYEGRVLVAEDNTINQLYIGELLRHFGCQFDIVSNGEEVVAAIMSTSYSMVLMDCQMPEMDGFEASRRIRELEEIEQLCGRVPILALTANAMASDRQRCLDAGMDDYLSKPIDSVKLEAVLHRYLQTCTS